MLRVSRYHAVGCFLFNRRGDHRRAGGAAPPAGKGRRHKVAAAPDGNALNQPPSETASPPWRRHSPCSPLPLASRRAPAPPTCADTLSARPTLRALRIAARLDPPRPARSFFSRIVRSLRAARISSAQQIEGSRATSLTPIGPAAGSCHRSHLPPQAQLTTTSNTTLTFPRSVPPKAPSRAPTPPACRILRQSWPQLARLGCRPIRRLRHPPTAAYPSRRPAVRRLRSCYSNNSKHRRRRRRSLRLRPLTCCLTCTRCSTGC